MNIDPSFALAVFTVVGSIAGALGGARSALNGTRERVKKIEKDLADHTEADHHVQLEAVQRLTRIETKLDQVIGDDA